MATNVRTKTLLQVTVENEFVDQIDQWRRFQDDLPNRAEAIRRLLVIGLAVKPKAKGKRAALQGELPLERRGQGPKVK